MSEWISVEQQLPPLKELVLMKIRPGTDYEPVAIGHCGHGYGGKRSWRVLHPRYTNDPEVVAWMPLPCKVDNPEWMI
jgi:hypothetical protein